MALAYRDDLRPNSSPLKVGAFVPILWGVMPVFPFAGRDAIHASGKPL
jgi:hypothetical protein